MLQLKPPLRRIKAFFAYFKNNTSSNYFEGFRRGSYTFSVRICSVYNMRSKRTVRSDNILHFQLEFSLIVQSSISKYTALWK